MKMVVIWPVMFPGFATNMCQAATAASPPWANEFSPYAETVAAGNAGPRGAGMTGKVHVMAPAITLGGYMSGNWYNTSQAGHGYQLELTSTHEMIAIWFVYTPDGTAQSWIYAEGFWDATKNPVTLPAIILTGARFPPNFNVTDVHRQQEQGWGTITFAFSDCNHGTVSWHSDAAGYNNANDTPLPISRLTDIDGTSCPH